MFTGIIETMGKVVNIRKENSNIHFTIESTISKDLKIDQSIAHNGACLTVVEINDNSHTVTAINETLMVTDLNHWKIGSFINLERCMLANGRFDGHIVQGHIDTIGICKEILNENGSWLFTFEYNTPDITVNKCSITVNGTSLTVAKSYNNSFTVAIIPYTYEHTVFKYLEAGSSVNLEFDIIGKYVSKMLGKYSIEK
ncbi:MAG: riboflavin synthase [Bacteroidetes bacterium]|nr:riboflavin synthase [Bacteroidota bacterium]